jgi:trigger factor
LLRGATKSLIELVDEDVPEPMVKSELQNKAQTLVAQLQAQGITLEYYLMMTGQDQATFTEMLRVSAIESVRLDLGLRSIADAEGFEITDEDFELEYRRVAMQYQQKPAQIRKTYEKNDLVYELRAELRKRKAMDLILETVDIVDPDGQPVDRSLIFPETDEDA